MDKSQEARVLKEFLNISSDPQSYSRRHSQLGTMLLAIGWGAIFLLTFIYLENYNNIVMISVIGLLGGGCLAFGLLLKQMAIQAKFLSKHLSETSIKERLEQISF